MTEQARVRPSAPKNESPEPEVGRLERALRDIQADARARAPRYLDDTVVPEGGE